MQDTTFKELSVPLANRIKANGTEYLYFGGTAYLGIPQNKDFLKFYSEGIQRFGINNGTSRGNNVQLCIYNETERFAAQIFNSESALITSSGYLAAQLTVKNLSCLGEVSYAPTTHPALWINGDPKIEPSFGSWAINIVEEINASSLENWVIICNSMNNLYPEIYDFSFIKQLNKNVTLIVDDSHGIGVNNEGLSALSSIPQCDNIDVVIVASMAKALGVDAGVILGTDKIIRQLKLSSEYLGASPPSAAGLFAFMHATDIYKNERLRLMEITANLCNFLKEKDDWHFIPNFPVFFSKNADLSRKLAGGDILVSSFPYPDKNGPILNRVVLCSWHTDDDLKRLKQYL